MATPTTYGTAQTWGLYDVTSFMTLQSDDIAKSDVIAAEVMNETGVVATLRLDDQRDEISLTGVLKPAASIPLPAQTITYGGVNYIIFNVDDAGTNNGFRRVTIKGKKYQGITTA